ncbi:PREDICTED: beta-defensin 127 [Chrysochloris asiatica]|uniref:Beta-defensin n=1 Tax=Chrysochloris asiatica TaxID=185453 RepID=A0A9B0TI44_CHRAS|nr:PREDICTED: beta-defensin 127 [Chrysochloris asiatica]
MRILLVTAILLFQKTTVTEQRKRCWSNYVQGYCRKICKATEMREILLCENGRYCCLNIKEMKAHKKVTRPPRPKLMTYAITLPQDYDPLLESYSSPTPKVYINQV